MVWVLLYYIHNQTTTTKENIMSKKIKLPLNCDSMTIADMKKAVQTLRRLQKRFDQLSEMEADKLVSYEQVCEEMLHTVDDLLTDYEV